MVSLPSLIRKVFPNLGPSPVGGSVPGEAWYDGTTEHLKFNSGPTFGEMGLATLLDTYGMVRSSSLNNIVASTDPNTVVPDGTLLVVYDPGYATYFTDFKDYTAGVAPAGWTARWITSQPWTVVADASPGVTNGKVLRLTAGSGRRAISWDLPSADTANNDLEIVVKHKTIGPGSGGINGTGWTSALFRASGAAGAEYGYVAGLGYASAGGQAFNNISSFHAGANVEKHVNGTYPTGVWYVTRVRAVGSDIKQRTWAYGSAEPSTWDNVNTVAQSDILTAGWVGLFAHGVTTAETKDFDWIGVATAGGTAPMGG